MIGIDLPIDRCRVRGALLAACFGAMSVATAVAQTAPVVSPPAASWPTKDGVYRTANFRFGTGETLAELRLHYLTLGSPHRNADGLVDNAVLLLHGTGGDASSLLAAPFSGVLFGPGQPLDTAKFFLIFPDDIGHGSSSKPSDGLHMRFPKYDYDDMVRSQHQMLLDGLKVDHLRLILGTSMGCMESFVWGETYPGFADALMPLACLPVQLAGRNRMMRYMAIQAIEQDPAWHGGEYTTEPVQGLRTATALTFVMGSAPLQLQKAAPTRPAAEAYIDNYLTARMRGADANDEIYYFDASRNYDPSAHLDRIQVPVMWINSADDYINPPELGIAERYAPQLAHGRFVLLPISDATRGHGTHTMAGVWQQYLVELLAESGPMGGAGKVAAK
jgi:homoserine O-acetyltransferase/O-succinyltransferase